MNTRRSIWLLLVIALASACTAPATPTAAPEPTATPVPPEPVVLPTTVVLPTPTLIPLPTAAGGVLPLAPAAGPLPAGCSPQVTANSIINVRGGPGTIYAIIGSMNQGETAQVDAKNADGTWWRILVPSAPDGHGWVAALVTTTTCMSPSLPVIAVSSLPAPYQAAVTNVVVSVDPGEEDVPGCAAGEAHKFTASATVFASGPMQVQYSWEIEGYGTTSPETLTFNAYESRNVSFTFKPAVVEGRHPVRLWIEGLNMQAWQYQTSYRINCT